MADFGSSRQSKARKAFGNAAESIALHGKQMEIFNVEIRQNSAIANRSAVLASYLGLCEAALIAGTCAGLQSRYNTEWLLTSSSSSSSSHQFSRVPWQSILCKMFSYVSLKRLTSYALLSGSCTSLVAITCLLFERNVYDIEFGRELWEIDNDLTGEMQEMIEIYKAQGLTDEEALIVTRIFAKRKESFAALMMVEELGYSRLHPLKLWEILVHVGLPTLCLKALSFTLPLLPLLYHSRHYMCNDVPSSGSGSNNEIMTSNTASTNNSSNTLPSLSVSEHLGYRQHVMVAGLLSTGAIVVGTLQAKVFYGAYAHKEQIIRTTVSAFAALSLVYTVSYVTARL